MAKSNKFRTILIVALVVVLIVVAYFAFANFNRGTEISYEEFTAKVEAGEVTHVYGVGGSFRVRVVGSEISADVFKNSKYADFTFTVAVGTEVSDVKTYLYNYNHSNLLVNDLDANGNIQYDANGAVKKKTLIPAQQIEYDTQPAQESWLSKLLPYMSLIFVAVLAFFIIKSIGAQNNKSIGFGKTKAKTTKPSQVKFSDVAGAKEEKQELVELVDFLKNPKKFTDLGARIPKGLLLVGPPGTGKTLLAKAVAGESNVPFFKISGSDFVEMFVGVGASRVRDLFDQAKQNAPCIVFIDEIDAVGRQRGAGLGGGNDEREQTLNQLLVEMDGFDSNEGIIVMAATNRPDVLDPALLRPGRFDRQIVVNMPDIKEREAILKVHARNKKFADNVTFTNIARITSGFSGADLENLLNEAAILAGRNNRPRITMIDINEAANKVMMGPQKRSHIVTERDKKITAYHESGHAILHKLLPLTDDVQEVSIVPRGMAGGYTMSRPETDDNYATVGKLNSLICTMMGGRVAEELIFKDFTTGASNDIEKATKIARRMVTQFGMSEKLGFVNLGSTSEVFIGRDYHNQVEYSEKTASIIDEEVHRILEENYAKAKELLTQNMDKLEAMATLLLEVETIYTDEVNMIMEGKPNAEIIQILKQRDEEEQKELERERQLKIEEDKKRIESLKNRAFEAMKQNGIIVEDEKIVENNAEKNQQEKAEVEENQSKEETQSEKQIDKIQDDKQKENNSEDNNQGDNK